MLTPAIVRLLRHKADLSAHPASRAWADALLAHGTVAEWMAEADSLPHIWFDDYLLPGIKPDLFLA